MKEEIPMDTVSLGNGPEQKFRAGGVTASIWKNTRSFSGQEREMKSVSLERRYKDKNGVWRSSTSFGMNELPKAIYVLSRAYGYVLTSEGKDGGAGD